MAASTATPYIPQDVDQVTTMIEALEGGRHASATNPKNKKKGGGGFKKNAFKVQNSPEGIEVFSWKLSDWDYKKPNLPTYARGLFTTTSTRTGHPEIVVRGYDKFFNTGEVPETKWENIIAQTRGSYELTLKENGCIIFISGLEDGSILVCSKHSTGGRLDSSSLTHSQAGESHLRKQLQNIGRSIEDLARELRARNATAVCELCDDDFEEHILQYGPDQAGLYLHGINLNLPEFATYPSAAVQQFAADWNFKKTDMLVMENIDEVKTFLEGVAESGAYDGRDVEGFVIRCKRKKTRDGPLVDWFFKYKFEEPYLMYRQWRECTKALIAGNKPRISKHKIITEKYLIYARKRLARNPKLAEEYAANHGIISLRDDFLASENLKGTEAANLDDGDAFESFPDVKKDVVITAIATIGCGKTTVGLALTQLFGWGHIQNDNISGSKRPPRFVAALKAELETKPAVYADRNNAQRHERNQLVTDMRLTMDEPTLIALNFKHSPTTMPDIRRLTQDRIIARGDNHQTIHAATDQNKFLGVMDNFLRRYEPCNPDEGPDAGFDTIIDLDPMAGSRANLGVVVEKLHALYPSIVPTMPTQEQLDAAMNFALSYKPDFKHQIPDRQPRTPRDRQPSISQQQPKQPRKPALEYVGVTVPAAEVHKALSAAFSAPELGEEHLKLWKHLNGNNRVPSTFHVTLLHRAASRDHGVLWNQYKMLWETSVNAGGDAAGQLGFCGVILERVVFNDKIMAIVVRLVDESNTWVCSNKVAHITVGTFDSKTKPRESNDLLVGWLETGPVGEVREVPLNRVELPGKVAAVLQRQ